MNAYAIVSGRFQPLHRDHTTFFRALKRLHLSRELIVCVLRRGPSLPIQMAPSADNFTLLGREAFSPERNPLPDWERFALVSMAIRCDQELAKSTMVMLRDRPDISWESSLQDLPTDRLWAFSITSEFDRTKAEAYRARGEMVEELSLPRTITGTEIRESLRRDARDLSFLPHGCLEYFSEHCLSYMTG